MTSLGWLVMSWVSAPNTLDRQVMAQAPAISTTRPPHDLLPYCTLHATAHVHTNHHSHCLANRHTTPCAIAHGHAHLDVNNAAVTSIVCGNDRHKRGQATDQTIRWVLAAGARSPFVTILDQPAETATRSLRTTARPAAAQSAQHS